MAIKIIVAVAAKGVIGFQDDIPWHIPADLKWFKQQTIGKVVVQGRKTLGSIIKRLHKPLPDRRNIVLTRYPGTIRIDGVEVFTDFDKVLELAEKADVMVIGGGEVYRLALPHAREMYVTTVYLDVLGDTFFPEFDKSEWKREVVRSLDERDPICFTHEIYRRVLPTGQV